MQDNDNPIFDKEYCDCYDIRADWFKFDKPLAEYLLNLADIDYNEQGKPVLIDGQFLALTTYAVLLYFVNGEIPPELENLFSQTSMKLSRLALAHAKKNVEEARSKVAENRFNGGKGGRPSRKNNT